MKAKLLKFQRSKRLKQNKGTILIVHTCITFNVSSYSSVDFFSCTFRISASSSSSLLLSSKFLTTENDEKMSQKRLEFYFSFSSIWLIVLMLSVCLFLERPRSVITFVKRSCIAEYSCWSCKSRLKKQAEVKRRGQRSNKGQYKKMTVWLFVNF